MNTYDLVVVLRVRVLSGDEQAASAHVLRMCEMHLDEMMESPAVQSAVVSAWHCEEVSK